MNGMNPINSKPGDFIQGIQTTIKELDEVKEEGNISDVFNNDVAATLSISPSGIAQASRAERESILQKSIVQLEGGYRKFNLTDEEACILKSFRLEEYYDIRSRMKDKDISAYKDLLKSEEISDKNSDPSEKFKVYAKAYNWAYGDVFDRIHKENPDVDIYVKSSGMPENHNYQIRNNRTSLIISTDEIRLLQSDKEYDRKAQDEVWNRILEKIRS